MTARIKHTVIGQYTITLYADRRVTVKGKRGYEGTTQCPTDEAAQTEYDASCALAKKVTPA